MTKLRTYLPDDRALAAWVRDVAAALQPRPLVAYRHVVSALPVDVRSTVTTMPKGVSMVRAVPEGGGNVLSGGDVEWSWRGDGQLRIESLSAVTSGAYSVVLELRMEL